MAFENKYSAADQLLHRIAFSTSKLQLSLSDIEDRIYSRQISKTTIIKPVFITALPRAGTTLLLELLVKQGEFCSHCYRDMPFVLMPMLWDKFSAPFRKKDVLRERAHGDGVMINVDSPEAFEEIIWKAFWRKNYKTDSILPWKDEQNEEFTTFLIQHLKKIITLRSSKSNESIRYVSKNNLNIARIKQILGIFPDAHIVLPFRDPIQHAGSLLKQHLNFLQVHKHDPFAKQYMEAIGHYDFGENLKPVNFTDWLSANDLPEPTTLSFWLHYWLASYRHLLAQTGNQVVLFNYDTFCQHPERELQKLGDFIKIKNMAALLKQSGKIRPARPHIGDLNDISPALMREVNTLFSALQNQSLLMSD